MKQKTELRLKKLFLFDIDGTLAVGDSLFDGSAELLEYIEKIGGKSIFITNNSTKSGVDYVKRFKEVFGLDTEASQFITSGFLTIRFLIEHYSTGKIFVVGTKSFIDELCQNGLYVTECAEENIDCVVVAYDSELTYQKLVEVSKILQSRDIPYYATNPDLRCPIDFGFIPDCGAICTIIEQTTGKTPIYLGKPNKEVVDFCIKQTGFSRKETLVVGDRLYTGIACGINGSVDSCVVFTGETRLEDMKRSAYPADFEFKSVKNLLECLQSSAAM